MSSGENSEQEAVATEQPKTVDECLRAEQVLQSPCSVDCRDNQWPPARFQLPCGAWLRINRTSFECATEPPPTSLKLSLCKNGSDGVPAVPLDLQLADCVGALAEGEEVLVYSAPQEAPSLLSSLLPVDDDSAPKPEERALRCDRYRCADTDAAQQWRVALLNAMHGRELAAPEQVVPREPSPAPVNAH